VSSVDDARPEPRRPAFVEVPKPGGGARRLTVLHSTDSTAYGRAVGRLAAMLERVLGPAVAANRGEPGPIVRLRPLREERPRVEARRRALVGTAGLVVKTDVRDCYPSMEPSVVASSLLRLGAHPSEIGPVRQLLEELGEAGVRGLPIGPDPSAVLANAVLTAADDAVRSADGRHLRWVDDVWAAARDDRHADEILDRTREALSRIGLRLNEAKTRTLECGESQALIHGLAGEDAYR